MAAPLRFVRDVRRRGSDDKLISLINVVFIILVFFMLMGRLVPPDVFEVDPPASTVTARMESGSTEILVAPDGRIAVDAELVSASSLAPILRRKFEGYIPAGAASIVVKADADTPMRVLQPVLKTLRTLDAERITLATDTTMMIEIRPVALAGRVVAVPGLAHVRDLPGLQ